MCKLIPGNTTAELACLPAAASRATVSNCSACMPCGVMICGKQSIDSRCLRHRGLRGRRRGNCRPLNCALCCLAFCPAPSASSMHSWKVRAGQPVLIYDRDLPIARIESTRYVKPRVICLCAYIRDVESALLPLLVDEPAPAASQRGNGRLHIHRREA